MLRDIPTGTQTRRCLEQSAQNPDVANFGFWIDISFSVCVLSYMMFQGLEGKTRHTNLNERVYKTVKTFGTVKTLLIKMNVITNKTALTVFNIIY